MKEFERRKGMRIVLDEEDDDDAIVAIDREYMELGLRVKKFIESYGTKYGFSRLSEIYKSECYKTMPDHMFEEIEKIENEAGAFIDREYIFDLS